MNKNNTQRLTILATIVVSVGLTACAGMTHRQQNAATGAAVGGIAGLNRQFTNTLQDGAGCAQCAFSRLRQRDTVVGVTHSLVQALDLRGEALRNRQASGVVLGAVDAQA
mgnify:CR=1 FL=1